MKICVIGNSHTAALKFGRDRSGPSSGIAMDFFATRGQSLRRTHVVQRRLLPDDAKVAAAFRYSSGHGAIDVDAYDHIVIVGAGLSPHWIVDLYGAYRSDDHVRGGKYVLSKAAFRAAAFGLIDRTAAMHLFRLLAPLCARPLIMCPNPLPGRGLLGMPGRDNWNELLLNEDADDIFDIYVSYLAVLRDKGVLVHEQPEETRATRMFSKDVYSFGFPAISDDVHKNADFGDLFFQDLITFMRGPGEGGRQAAMDQPRPNVSSKA